MELQSLLKKPLPTMPSEIVGALKTNAITKTSFADKNEILTNPNLQREVGYTKMQDGTYLVSMVCPMDGISADMIEWWFWWHAQDSLRYQVWYPGEHMGIKHSKKDRDFFEQPDVPEFVPNTQYPVERIGGMKMPLRIDFVTPEDFGFSRQSMEENNIPIIVCGHVGAFNNLVKHTEMAHIFKQTDEGLFMISRFWLGKTMTNPLLRKLIITEDMARGMAEHCCIEYRNLCEILPILYEEYK
ncbi:MAG: DAPG hydrolase family protein [Acutalibacteraceae bacterium]